MVHSLHACSVRGKVITGVAQDIWPHIGGLQIKKDNLKFGQNISKGQVKSPYSTTIC